jgi:phosphopantothenoylcysteine decarboxylase/phosphopantothenate--cysteine ligase
MLTTTIMATKAPVFFAPAMNTNMYENFIVEKNMRLLAERGCHIIEADKGMLACGVEGIGRLPKTEKIIGEIESFFLNGESLRGKKVLVTAAGTIEPIDPVRYIGNRSSGKMGYAIAAEAKARGASVVLVSGPSALVPPAGVKFYAVETARQMQEIVLSEFADTDITIKAAAVADYRAKEIAPNKIKKHDEELVIELEKNPDILLELGKRKKDGQVLVGFAAETQDLLKYATDKLRRKNLDMIVANDVSVKGAGFNSDENLIKLIYPSGKIEEYPMAAKKALAGVILDKITGLI